MKIKNWTDFLHKNIPITRAMGMEVVEVSGERVRIFMPFDKNKNHKETAFGGSLNALLTLSCWTWLEVFQREQKIPNETVIQRSHTEYLLPVTEDFVAQCSAPDKKQLGKFVEMMERRGVGRLTLSAQILMNGESAATFSGQFVAKRQ